jgi:plasmid stabilization system protein ParE
LRFHPEAILEGREARRWYGERSELIEERFHLALLRSLIDLAEAPERWPPDEDDLRHARVSGFPYQVIYWTNGQEILVVAIAHAKRRPGYWRQRRFEV